MATFLELVQATARESGTVPNWQSIATINGMTGREARFVHWVREAYTSIQSSSEDWRWLRAEFTGTILPGVTEYAPDALGITRFSHWFTGGERYVSPFTLYSVAQGPAGEGFLPVADWDRFRRAYATGEPQVGQPGVVTVDPQDRLVVGPTPDASYILRGEYVRSPQILVNDGDVPEMPAAHHDAIRYQALLFMATYDEAFEQEPRWRFELAKHMAALTRKQTPDFTWAAPLA